MSQARTYSKEIPTLMETHFQQLNHDSGINIDVIQERGYRSVIDRNELKKLGFAEYQSRVPGLLVPIRGVDGSVVGYQFKPDVSRVDRKRKKIKYETAKGTSNRIDSPPHCQELLANPSIPLWVAEGIKKADCLASLGECAVALTGIWNWRGKNIKGGTTVLPDFDSIALNDRLIYLAPDSDATTNPAVKQGANRLGAFLTSRKARVLMVILPPLANKSKCGVDDFVVGGGTLERLKTLAISLEEIAEDGERELHRNYFLIDDQLYLEVRKYNGDYCFVSLDNKGSIKLLPEIVLKGQTIKPRPLPQLEGKAISIVGMPDEGIVHCRLLNAANLYSKIVAHLATYVDLLPLDLQLCAYYVLFTWFYQKVDTLGYLRFIADTGKGKSRAQKVVGDVCFYPVSASGASSFSGTARLNNRWHGTLVIDEADIGGDKEHQFVKYLNLGFERGKYYVLSDKQNPKFQEYFDPFSPKILAMRQPFRDNATEGRLLSISTHETSNKDIPIILPPNYQSETQQLRNELALFSLQNWGKVDGRKMIGFRDLQIEPRLKQLAMPLSVIFQLWPEGSHRFKEYLLKRQTEVRKTRSFSWEGSLVNLVIAVATGNLSLKEEFADYYTTGEAIPQAITPTMVAKQIRTSAKSVTQGLHSVGFEVEWRSITVNQLSDETTKRVRAYCLTDYRIWQEIISRYYYSEEKKPIEIPAVLKSSKYVGRVEETVPTVPSVPTATDDDRSGTDGTDGTLPRTQQSALKVAEKGEEWEEL
ncbi:DUF3854 domain-containing protein [Chloroflexota bacterium]